MLYKILIATALVVASPVVKAESNRDLLFTASQVALATAQVPDSHSSWGRFELNPVLGKGAFGPRHLAIKTAVAVSTLAGQRHPAFKRHRRVFTIVNFAVAGVTLAVAKRNYGLRFSR